MDALEAAHRRLHNQRLSGVRFADPVSVVRHFGAMQAQEFALAKWSVGQRTQDSRDGDVQRALDDGMILRTHALRPTWHFVAASDLVWIQRLTGPRVHAFNRYYNRQHGIDADLTATAAKLITAALRDGNHLTRTELAQVLERAGVAASGGRLAYLIMGAELEGLIANGTIRGKQHTYALVSERAPDQIELDGDQALAELTRRYFTSHGPATVKDFAWWSSLTVTQIRRGLAILGDELEQDTVNGLTVYFVPGAAPRRDRSPTAYALQPYDEYGVAYTESRRVTNVAQLELKVPNENTPILPLVLDSQIIGFWRRTVTGRTIQVQPLPVATLTAAQRKAITAALTRYGAFTGQPLTIDWA